MALKLRVNEVTAMELAAGEEPDPEVVVVEDELLLPQAVATRPPTSNMVASPRLVFSLKVVSPPNSRSAERAVAARSHGQ
jgi:hypothetical protein